MLFESNSIDRQTDRQTRIVLWGWFGYYNFGDDLLLHTMLSELQNSGKFDISIGMENKYDSLPENINQIKRGYKQLFLAADENDVLIIGPGGIFPFVKFNKTALFFLIIDYWKKKNKKICFFGFGISQNISYINKIIWKKIIRKSDLFATRNTEFLNTINVKETSKIFSIPDVALHNHFSITEEHITDKIVGIAVASLNNNEQSEVNVWVKVVNKLLENNYHVDLIAFTKGSDDDLIDKIEGCIKNKSVNLIHYDNLSTALKRWGSYCFTICMRFHANILSVLYETPLVSIGYGVKSQTLIHDIGLDDFLLLWNNSNSAYLGNKYEIDDNSIISCCEKVINNKEYIRNKLKQYRLKSYEEVENAFKKLLLVINE